MLVEGGHLLVRALFVGGEAGRRRGVGGERLGEVGRYRAGHVGVNAEQLRRGLYTHQLRDERAPVAALRDVLVVSEALHQHGPGARDLGGVPAVIGRGRLARIAVARHRRDHQMEGVRCLPAVRRGIREGIDDLQLLEDRAGPSVRDDERQRVFVLRTHVDEVNVEAVDLGHEVGQGLQLRLALAPVVVRRPVARELLDRRELRALRYVRDRFSFRPPRRVDALTQFGELRVRNIRHLKRTNRGLAGRLRAAGLCRAWLGHNELLLRASWNRAGWRAPAHEGSGSALEGVRPVGHVGESVRTRRTRFRSATYGTRSRHRRGVFQRDGLREQHVCSRATGVLQAIGVQLRQPRVQGSEAGAGVLGRREIRRHVGERREQLGGATVLSASSSARECGPSRRAGGRAAGRGMQGTALALPSTSCPRSRWRYGQLLDRTPRSARSSA